MKKCFTFLLLLFILLFLIFSPALISAGYDRNVFTEKNKDLSDDFRGILEVWHVVSFKTAEGSGYQYLKERCRSFEKKTPYVFFDIKGLSTEKARELLEQGEKPDIISYPMGFLSAKAELMLWSAEADLVDAASNSGANGIPYMADCYKLLINKDLLREYGVHQYYDEPTAEMLSEIMRNVNDPEKEISPIGATDADGRHPLRAFQHLLFDSNEIFPTKSEVKTADDFLRGKCAMLICPYSESVSLMKKGLNFSVESCSFSRYSDLLQMIGAFKSDDPAKNEMMQRFMKTLFSASSQKNLEKIRMLPCVLINDIYETDAERKEDYQRFSKNVMIIK